MAQRSLYVRLLPLQLLMAARHQPRPPLLSLPI
jgi:hypothetical protein